MALQLAPPFVLFEHATAPYPRIERARGGGIDRQLLDIDIGQAAVNDIPGSTSIRACEHPAKRPSIERAWCQRRSAAY